MPTWTKEKLIEYERRRQKLYPMGAVGAGERKPSAQPALVKDTPAKPRRPSRVEVVVSIIVCQRRLFDDDNSISGGTKALRDAIADSLGVKDHDKRLRWCYGQLHCKGPEGVIVMIQRL